MPGSPGSSLPSLPCTASPCRKMPGPSVLTTRPLPASQNMHVRIATNAAQHHEPQLICASQTMLRPMQATRKHSPNERYHKNGTTRPVLNAMKRSLGQGTCLLGQQIAMQRWRLAELSLWPSKRAHPDPEQPV